MSLSNYERMIELAEDVFDAKNDPHQLDVDEKVIEHLLKIHPSTVAELEDSNGPFCWILLIPTTSRLMNLFLQNEISEKELYLQTPLNIKYEAIYLCSAMLLQEYQGKGMAKALTVKAIKSICNIHPVESLFVWPFSKKGAILAETIATELGLPLFKKR